MTEDGVEYVFDAIKESDGDKKTLETWQDFYKTELQEYKDNQKEPTFYYSCSSCKSVTDTGTSQPDKCETCGKPITLMKD